MINYDINLSLSLYKPCLLQPCRWTWLCRCWRSGRGGTWRRASWWRTTRPPPSPSTTYTTTSTSAAGAELSTILQEVSHCPEKAPSKFFSLLKALWNVAKIRWQLQAGPRPGTTSPSWRGRCSTPPSWAPRTARRVEWGSCSWRWSSLSRKHLGFHSSTSKIFNWKSLPLKIVRLDSLSGFLGYKLRRIEMWEVYCVAKCLMMNVPYIQISK